MRGPRTTGGKHNYFPLENESNRCRGEKKSLAKEKPLLLDPLLVCDVDLIYITDDGRAEPLMPNPSDLRNLRAQRSIELYHLNEDDVVKLRAVIRKQILRLIQTGDALASHGSPASLANLAAVKQGIEEYLASDAPYVTMTRQLVQSITGRGASWLDDVREIELPIEFPPEP
jgi:hypothetical protein